MLDIKLIRENPKIVKDNLEKRFLENQIHLVDNLIHYDQEWRKLKQEVDQLKHQRNELSEEINKLIKEDRKNLAEHKIFQVKDIPKKIKLLEDNQRILREKIISILTRLPNIIHKSVPKGKNASKNKVIRMFGKKPKFKFELKSHGDLIETLNVADFKNAAEVSGSGFVYLKGKLALLDLALMRFALDYLIKKGFTLVEPPLMLRSAPYKGVTDLDFFRDQLYKIENEDLFLIATSEHPLVAMHMNKIFNEKDLPLKYIGISPNFRKEIGSHGVDSRGLFRMHQFNKVEQVVFCKKEDSWKFLEEIQNNTEILFKKLGIPFRVVNICSGELGQIAAKRYDIEAWFPRENEYKEVTSASNCLSYQSVSLNIKYKDKERKEYAHTLNNTAIATSRAMRVILENYQQKDGSIKIPTALQKYTGFKKIEKE